MNSYLSFRKVKVTAAICEQSSFPNFLAQKAMLSLHVALKRNNNVKYHEYEHNKINLCMKR